MIVEFEGKTPEIEETAFIAANATICGHVMIQKDCSIWYSAVLRGDESSISIGERSNVQDNATIHCDRGLPVVIGDDVTIGHNAIVHSCTIGNGTVVGMGAIILNQARIGEGCIIAAGAVVMSKMEVPSNMMVAGTPAVIKKTLGDDAIQKNIDNAHEYVKLASIYKKSGR
jgi:carbonic anhydrase/acetyltransferase-like protein (isoleucine patch superfamily)